VWTWDITWVPGPITGRFFYLYLILDIFSRMIMGWEVHEREGSDLAARLVEQTVWAEGCILKPLVLQQRQSVFGGIVPDVQVPPGMAEAGLCNTCCGTSLGEGLRDLVQRRAHAQRYRLRASGPAPSGTGRSHPSVSARYLQASPRRQPGEVVRTHPILAPPKCRVA
jgi:hypothetical protein